MLPSAILGDLLGNDGFRLSSRRFDASGQRSNCTLHRAANSCADLARRSGSAGPPGAAVSMPPGGPLPPRPARRRHLSAQIPRYKGHYGTRIRYSAILFLRGPPVALPPSSVLKSPRGGRLPEPQIAHHQVHRTGDTSTMHHRRLGWRPRRQHCCCGVRPGDQGPARWRATDSRRNRAIGELPFLSLRQSRTSPCQARDGIGHAEFQIPNQGSRAVSHDSCRDRRRRPRDRIFGRCKFRSCSMFSACQPSRLGHSRRCVGPVPMSLQKRSDEAISIETAHP